MEEECALWQDYARRYFRRRVRDANHVEELVQETCVRAWVSRHKGRVIRVAPTWIRGISWRVLIDHYRAEYAQRGRLGLPVAWKLDELSTRPRFRTLTVNGTRIGLFRLLQVLEETVAEMPASWRPFMEQRMEGRTMKEIAQSHGLSLNVVRMRLYRGRRHLRQAIQRRLEREEEDVRR